MEATFNLRAETFFGIKISQKRKCNVKVSLESRKIILKLKWQKLAFGWLILSIYFEMIHPDTTNVTNTLQSTKNTGLKLYWERKKMMCVCHLIAPTFMKFLWYLKNNHISCVWRSFSFSFMAKMFNFGHICGFDPVRGGSVCVLIIGLQLFFQTFSSPFFW